MVGSLLCESTYCLNCCHTRLVCNKGQVRHSGRNLFSPAAFPSQLNQSRFHQPDACGFSPSERLPSVAARSVSGRLCFHLRHLLFGSRRREAACGHRPRHPEEPTRPPVRRGHVIPRLHHRRGGSGGDPARSRTSAATPCCARVHVKQSRRPLLLTTASPPTCCETPPPHKLCRLTNMDPPHSTATVSSLLI